MAAFDDVTSEWTAERFLAAVGERLGTSYRQCSDGWFRWLTPFDDETHERHANHARYALARLPQVMPGLDPRPTDGGWPAILFANQDDHLAYEALFGGTGSSIISGGSWCSWPVGHLAIPISQWDSLDAAFAHELVHAVLWDEGVPHWLQEGLATEVETRMGNRQAPLNDLHGWTKTVAFWRAHPAESFWSGAAFRDPTSSEHAYRLAQVVGGRWARNPQALSAVRAVKRAEWDDADGVLRRLVGSDRAGLLAAILTPSRQRGWLERLLFALFVGKAP